MSTATLEAPPSTGTAVVPVRASNRLMGKQELRKHVAAIHTSGELGLLERKLVNVLLLNAYDQLTTERRHSIPTKLLMAMLGWTEGEDTSLLKKALLKIVSTPVEFNLMDPNQDPKKASRWTATALLAQAELINGMCEYEYSSRLAQELSDPDVYAIINVGMQRQFAGGYALTLYENCVRYRNVGATGWMDLPRFRKIMGAMAPTYDDYRRLSELVLKRAVMEVNRVSDITITAEFEKKGVKVVAVRFKVEEKAQQSIFAGSDAQADAARQSETFKRLISHGIGEKLAVAWIVQDEQRAREALNMTEQKARTNSIKTTTGGYLRKLIEDPTIDFSKSAFEREQAERQAREKAEAAAAAGATLTAEQEKEARSEKIKQLVRALTPEQVKVAAAEYVAGLGATMAETYDHSTGQFRSTVERISFQTWLRGQIAEKHGLTAEKHPA